MIEENILKGKIDFGNSKLTDLAIKAIKEMLNPDQKKRPSARKVLSMKFFTTKLKINKSVSNPLM